MPYLHGIRIQENPTSIPTPARNDAGVPVIFGTAPVNLAKDPENATNKLFLCNTWSEARDAVGYSDDYANYTLCQAVDAFFRVFAVGPIVICNVLDPATHKTTYTETKSVVENQAVFDTFGVVLSTVTAKDGEQASLTLDTDYTIGFGENGCPVVTLIKEDVTEVTLTGQKLSPSSVTASSVIGSYDAETGIETGLELVRKVYPELSVVPSLLLAPGWSKNPLVAIALNEKCTDISGMFRCQCIVDLDCGASGAKKYSDAPDAKEENGYNSENMIVLWPMAKVLGKVMAFSAIYAAMVTYVDTQNDSVPNLSPSNTSLRINMAVLEDGTEVNLDIKQANELNGAGIVTILNLDGLKAWGNNTAAYPAVTDPKDRWIACRRFFSWWENNFILNYMVKIDSPTNTVLIESVVDSENVRGNSLVSQGKAAGIRTEYRTEDNTPDKILEGKITFRQYLAPFPPAEDILNIVEYDVNMIQAALGGE